MTVNISDLKTKNQGLINEIDEIRLQNDKMRVLVTDLKGKNQRMVL